jgi:hypothetical protein
MRTVLKITTIAALIVSGSAMAQTGGAAAGGSVGAATGSVGTSTGGAGTVGTTTTGTGVGTSTLGTGVNTTTGTTGVNTSAKTGTSSTTNTTSANPGTTTSAGANWDSQESYWRKTYPSRPYYNSSRDYTTYEPAYRYGVDLYNQNPGKSYSQLDQSKLNTGWTSARGSSALDWNAAQLATRDAYDRMNTANTAR